MVRRVSDPGEFEQTVQSDDAALTWKKFEKAFKKRDYELAAKLLLKRIDLYGEQSGPVPPAKLRELAGITLLRLRRTKEGVAQLERSVELAPHSARANFKLGLGYGRLRRENDALRQFERTLSLEPANPEYLCRYAAQLNRLDRPDEAIEAYREALRQDPTYQTALDALGEPGIDDTAQTRLAKRVR